MRSQRSNQNRWANSAASALLAGWAGRGRGHGLCGRTEGAVFHLQGCLQDGHAPQARRSRSVSSFKGRVTLLIYPQPLSERSVWGTSRDANVKLTTQPPL